MLAAVEDVSTEGGAKKGVGWGRGFCVIGAVDVILGSVILYAYLGKSVAQDLPDRPKIPSKSRPITKWRGKWKIARVRRSTKKLSVYI